VRTIQRRVTGSVRLKLFKGSCRVVGRTSPHATLERPASMVDRPAAEGLLA
jgi:argininosuccinate synthase